MDSYTTGMLLDNIRRMCIVGIGVKLRSRTATSMGAGGSPAQTGAHLLIPLLQVTELLETHDGRQQGR